MAQLDFFIDKDGIEHAVCPACGGCMSCGCACAEENKLQNPVGSALTAGSVAKPKEN